MICFLLSSTRKDEDELDHLGAYILYGLEFFKML